jgi:hypothetical protein
MKNLGFILLLIVVFPVNAQKNYRGHLGTEISVGLGQVDKYYPNGLIKYRTVIPSISFFYNYSYFRTGFNGSYQMSEFSSAFLLSSELGINLLGKKRDCKSFLGPTVKYGYYLDGPMYDFGKSNLTYRLLLIYKGLTFGVDFGRTFPNFQATYTTESVRHWYLDLGYTFCFRKKNLKE